MRALIVLFAALLAALGVVDGANPCFDRCQSGSDSVRLNECGLTDDDIPDTAMCLDTVGRDNIEALYLHDNDLTTLPAEFFQGLDGLRVLFLYSNPLSALPPRLFDGLGQLQYLIIANAQLTSTLPDDLFNGLASLGSLWLANSTLSVLPPGVFDGLENLTGLYLGYNQLTTLPEGLFNDLQSLNYLSLEGNPDLQCVPANDATDFRVDDVSFDQCECIPAEAVLCDEGLECMPGESGYTCDVAMRKL